MKKTIFSLVALLTAVCALSTSLFADVRLPSIISDNMVLQQGKQLPFWGWAEAGEKVTVTVGEQSASTTAGDNGKWRVDMPAVKETGEISVTVAGNNTLVIKNVLVGNNWICSGQSNMDWTVANSNNPKEEIANANYPEIRLYRAAHTVRATPQEDVKGEWVLCSPETIPNRTAVGYFFGREVHKRTGQPVGLIQTAWGGTPAESWTSMDKLQSIPELKPIVERWDNIVNNHDQIMAKYQERVKARKLEIELAKKAGKKPPRAGIRAPYNASHPHRAASLYNGMINPLIPFAIQGAVWYQGESNAGRAYQYRTLFSAMITNWREKWGQGDFPFYYVQLANFRAIKEEPGDDAWAELREAQSMALKLPNTGQAVIIDIGEADDIHPRNKQDVGFRLAVIALNQIFGKTDVVYSGPVYKSMKVEGNSIRLSFDHLGGGLVAKGEDQTLKGFAIAGEDKKFVWADAKIEGDTIVVSAEGVSVPVAVRYAWATNPVCNLYNAAGIPASPFRTDTWPGMTVGNK